MSSEKKKLLKYLLISIFITLIDLAIVYILRFFFHQSLVFSNTIGVVSGCIVQYFLTSKYVFDVKRDRKSIIIFFGTFLVGLVLADITIYLTDMALKGYFTEKIVFFVAKGASMVVPFFVIYYLRRYLYEGTKSK